MSTAWSHIRVRSVSQEIAVPASSVRAGPGLREVVHDMPNQTPEAEPVLIRFEGELSTVGGTTLVRLPGPASEQLPSRGQVAVHATLEGHPFQTVVEPDGRRGHWLRIGRAVRAAAGAGSGDTVEVTLAVTPEWPEPDVPEDLAVALTEASTTVHTLWQDITPMARWEWVRWVRATKSPKTRQRRIAVAVSKMGDGKRRPCCFDLSSCTDPAVATSGKLSEPSH